MAQTKTTADKSVKKVAPKAENTRISYTASAIEHDFAEHLKYTQDADVFHTSMQGRYDALAYSIRDRIIHQWDISRKTHQKVPLDYTMSYEKSGQKISEAGAKKPLPEGGGLSPYEGEERWIVMSKMYYWAQEYAKRYANEMYVYMETDDFICYKVTQNINRVFNFAIDYGYNTSDSVNAIGG